MENRMCEGSVVECKVGLVNEKSLVNSGYNVRKETQETRG